MFSACIPTFTLYFFGFFARDSLPERAALLAVQVVVLIFTKARFCPFKTDAWGTVSVFNFAFMVMEKIGYFCSVFFALLLIHYRRERIGTVLKETSRLAAVLERLLKKRNTRDEAFARFFCRFVVIQCSLSCLCPIMGIIGVVDCSICGYGAMIMDFHYFMVASLLCMLLARTESLIVDVHYGAFTLTKVRDRFLKIQIIRALLSIDDHSREIAESINECFTEVNLAFFTVEMTIVVNTIISGINGPNVCECMTWFTMYCLNMFLRISRMSKLRRKVSTRSNILHFIHSLSVIIALLRHCERI